MKNSGVSPMSGVIRSYKVVNQSAREEKVRDSERSAAFDHRLHAQQRRTCPLTANSCRSGEVYLPALNLNWLQ